MEVINFGVYFLFYAGIFSPSVYAVTRNILYVVKNDHTISLNGIPCALRKSENKNVAVKIPVGNNEDNGNKDEVCYGLEHDWLDIKTYDSGYYYMEKQEVEEIFNPPISLSKAQKTSIQWILPCSFDVGAILIIHITSPSHEFSFEFNLLDIVKDNLDIKITENILHHLKFVKKGQNDDNVVASTFSLTDGWLVGKERTPCPLIYGSSYQISLKSYTKNISSSLDGETLFEIGHNVGPPKDATSLTIRNGGESPLIVHKITMIGHV